MTQQNFRKKLSYFAAGNIVMRLLSPYYEHKPSSVKISLTDSEISGQPIYDDASCEKNYAITDFVYFKPHVDVATWDCMLLVAGFIAVSIEDNTEVDWSDENIIDATEIYVLRTIWHRITTRKKWDNTTPFIVEARKLLIEHWDAVQVYAAELMKNLEIDIDKINSLYPDQEYLNCKSLESGHDLLEYNDKYQSLFEDYCKRKAR